MIEIDLDLIKKYDKPGPRYTSYPTAPHFRDGFDPAEYKSELERTNAPDKESEYSLYFHIPYCDTLCYFCGCNMIITHNRGRIGEYLEYLKKEMDLFSPMINPGRRAAQLHWGGGTPTYLEPDEITALTECIKKHFTFTDDAEVSCEVDPRGLTFEHLKALRQSGFNRISMGVQDFNYEVQKAVNRIQDESLIRRIVGWVRDLEFHSINIDLIYGLPFQTPQTFSDTINKIIDISPDRIAVFNYAHVPWMKKHMSLINENDLPRPDEKLQILGNTITGFTSAGYEFIGMDHFAKPDDELTVALREKRLYRNFQGYSIKAGTDLYAFGITGISQTERMYVQNYKTEKEYYEFVNSGRLPVAKGYRLNDDDMLRRHVIMRLMCDFELNPGMIGKLYNIDFNQYFAESIALLEPMKNDGLVEITPERIKVTSAGRLLIRNIAMNFDAYLLKKEDAGKYSRTV